MNVSLSHLTVLPYKLPFALNFYSVKLKENIDAITVMCDKNTFISSYLESSHSFPVFSNIIS